MASEEGTVESTEAAPKRPGRKPMDDAAREQRKAVRQYLSALAGRRPGRRRTMESVERDMAKVQALIETSKDPVQTVLLQQRRLDLIHEGQALNVDVDMTALEDAFVAVALAFSKENKISAKAWRTMGVTDSVITRAGL